MSLEYSLKDYRQQLLTTTRLGKKTTRLGFGRPCFTD